MRVGALVLRAEIVYLGAEALVFGVGAIGFCVLFDYLDPFDYPRVTEP